MEVTAPVTDYIIRSTFMNNELDAANEANVTLLTSATEVVTLDLGTVVVGDRFLVSWQYWGPKTTSGDVLTSISKASGTATIVVLSYGGALTSRLYVADGFTIADCITGILKITGSGTLVLKATGSCSHGTLLVNAYAGMIYAVQLKNV